MIKKAHKYKKAMCESVCVRIRFLLLLTTVLQWVKVEMKAKCIINEMHLNYARWPDNGNEQG